MVKKVKKLCSDGCPSIKAAADEMGVLHDKSHAGCPQSNAVVENMMRIVTAGTRATLESAGLLLCFWPYALAHYCHAHNIAPQSDGSESAWTLRTHREWDGLVIPFGFGAAIEYLPINDNDREHIQRFRCMLLPERFIGYVQHLGLRLIWGHVPHLQRGNRELLPL